MAIIVIRSEQHSANDPEVRDDKRFETIDEAINFLTELRDGKPKAAAPVVEQDPPFVADPVKVATTHAPMGTIVMSEGGPMTEPSAPAGDTSDLADVLGTPAQATADAGGDATGDENAEDQTGKDEPDDVDAPPTTGTTSELEALLADGPQ